VFFTSFVVAFVVLMFLFVFVLLIGNPGEATEKEIQEN